MESSRQSRPTSRRGECTHSPRLARLACTRARSGAAPLASMMPGALQAQKRHRNFGTLRPIGSCIVARVARMHAVHTEASYARSAAPMHVLRRLARLSRVLSTLRALLPETDHKHAHPARCVSATRRTCPGLVILVSGVGLVTGYR